jgi:hypothetical protein
MATFIEATPSSHAPIEGVSQKSVQFPLNARECMRCEREQRNSLRVIRIVRLKPNGTGKLRAAGPLIEFAEKHLSRVIAALQELQSEGAQ